MELSTKLDDLSRVEAKVQTACIIVTGLGESLVVVLAS